MLVLSAAHQRVLESTDPKGVLLLDLTTFAGRRLLALGDYEIVAGGLTYMPTQNIVLEQTAEYAGLGTARFRTVTDIRRRDWFVDAGTGSIRVASAKLEVMLSLLDPEAAPGTSPFLAPLVQFSLRGEEAGSGFNRSSVTVNWLDRWAAASEKRWRLSRAHQRAEHSGDSSLDQIGKLPPSGGVDLGEVT